MHRLAQDRTNSGRGVVTKLRISIPQEESLARMLKGLFKQSVDTPCIPDFNIRVGTDFESLHRRSYVVIRFTRIVLASSNATLSDAVVYNVTVHTGVHTRLVILTGTPQCPRRV
jgi:hypothetical protein